MTTDPNQGFFALAIIACGIWFVRDLLKGPRSMTYYDALAILNERERHEYACIFGTQDEQRLAVLDALAPEAREIVALYTERNR